MRKAAIIIVLALMFPLCLYADKWFTFSVDFNVTRDCSVCFWQYGTTSGFDEETVDITSHLGESSFAFATLGLSFSGETVISLDLGWTSFYKRTGTEGSYLLDTGTSMDYDLTLNTKGTASLYSWSESETETEDGFMYGCQILLSRKKLVEHRSPGDLGIAANESGSRALADLYISNLDSEDAENGEYVSFMICYITTE